jgi:hypothetical protein
VHTVAPLSDEKVPSAQGWQISPSLNVPEVNILHSPPGVTPITAAQSVVVQGTYTLPSLTYKTSFCRAGAGCAPKPPPPNQPSPNPPDAVGAGAGVGAVVLTEKTANINIRKFSVYRIIGQPQAKSRQKTRSKRKRRTSRPS